MHTKMSGCPSYNDVTTSNANLQNLFINAKYFIDSQFGNDATAVFFDSAKPYQNIGTVAGLVQPGDVVFVQPGIYSTPTINLNDAIWYFSAGAVTTTLITGSGSVFGFGEFVGQSPVININLLSSSLFFQAYKVRTASDYAIKINNGNARFDITRLEAPAGFQISGAADVDANVKEFDGLGEFIQIESTASGEFCCQCQDLDCGVGIRCFSNLFTVNLLAQCVACTSEYFIVAADSSVASRSDLRINASISRIECSGLLDVSGIPSVMDTLSQPRVNLNIQSINSVNQVAFPILRIGYALCNFTYDVLAFSYAVNIPYIIVISDGGILHMNGKQTFNSDQTLASDVGFVSVSATSFAGFRANIVELFITSQIINCQAAGEVLLDVASLTNISSSGRPAIMNTGQCIINVRKLLMLAADGSSIINNLGTMRFEVAAYQCQTNGSQIISNQSQLQIRIGVLIVFGSGNTCIGSSGSVVGIAVGSVRLEGNSNTAIRASGPTIMDIGQILGNLQPGNIGIIVDDPGQLYGRVGRILMQDQSCLEFHSSRESNISFDWMINGENAYVIYVDGTGEVTMSGNAITAGSVKYPIYIAAQNSRFNIDLVRLDITIGCAAPIYISAPDSEINIDIQHFHVVGEIGSAGIFLERGNLTLSGNYYMRSNTNVPLILASNDSTLCANLGFVDTNCSILETNSSGDVWYNAVRSVTQLAFNNVIYNGTGPITIGGYFTTPGDYNMYYVTFATIARVLNATMFSASRNIHSDIPTVKIVCNTGIGNAGLSNVTDVPAGQFVTDPAVL